MTHVSATPRLEPELQTGKPPLLRADPGGDAIRWAAEHRGAVRAAVARHGALLIRGLGLSAPAEIEAVFGELGDLQPERERFAPRHRYSERVYPSTRWPPNQPMCMHHELSYALTFPGVMLFACLVPPDKGGATPVADSAAVLDALPAELVRRFERHGWLLIRNYNDDVGASVVEAFGSDDPRVVESYCRANAIACARRPDGRLQTRQRRSAVVRHPATGGRCWFNQIAFLSEWTIDPEVREYLSEIHGADGLPFCTRFGNGDAIGADIVQTINDAYEAHSVRERWQAGDLMLVDNLRAAHGREPYEGPREVVVGLADTVSLSDCSPTIDVTAE